MRLLRRLALVLLPLLILLAILEGIVRLLPEPDGFHTRVRAFSDAACVRDQALGHRLRPGVNVDVGGIAYEISSLGLRNPELRNPTSGTGQRILVLGDSVTMGWGVAETDTFSRQLEAILSEAGRPVEVVNAGILAYGTHEEALLLEELGPTLNPDLLLLGYFPNDPGGWEASTSLPGPSWSKLWRMFLPHLLGFAARFGWVDTAPEHYRKLHDLESETWRGVREDLKRISDWTKQRDIPATLLLLPDLSLTPYPLEDVHQTVAQEARSLGFDVLDLAPLVKSATPREQWVQPDDAHPNAKTHADYAQAIARHLRHQPPSSCP